MVMDFNFVRLGVVRDMRVMPTRQNDQVTFHKELREGESLVGTNT